MSQRRDNRDAAFEYAVSVVDGKKTAGKLVKLACRRHLDDLEDGPKRGIRYSREAADHVIDFFKFLHHSKGEWAGTPIELEGWEEFSLRVLFGWRRKDGLRRFRVAYEEVARKNGKSTLAAGIGLYLFFGDGEAGAEVYTAATKRDQARIVHGEAVRMVKASPMLSSRVAVYKDNLNIPNTASKFEPLGADEDTLDGLNVHGAIIDELHAHKTRNVYDVLDTATGARRQPLLFSITTAGFDRKSICWELHDYGSKVLRGIVPDDSFFCFIACLDDGDDWRDEVNWPKANPNLGISVKLDDLRRKAEKAKEMPSAQNAFRRLHLNEWTEQSDRWIDISAWDKCCGAVDVTELEKEECFAGLDLSSTSDITALVLVFPSDDICKVVPFFWVPGENIKKRSDKDGVPYTAWAAEGFIIPTEGNIVDYDAIRKFINDLDKKFNIREIAIDRWNATQLATQLTGDGFTIVPFGQGFASMSAPCKELEKMILSGKIAHGGNPVMRWMASNVAVKQDAAGNTKPDKSKSSEKIDGIVSLIMAVDRYVRAQAGEDFVYKTRGIAFA